MKTGGRSVSLWQWSRLILSALVVLLLTGVGRAADRPNILWLTSEDHGPQMGCYGDQFATTPNVDRLAARGMIYLHCWSCAPVCAPARTALISGLYPPSTGSEHMRSLVAYPAGMRMFPQFLREAGYYCTNNSKEDYNLAQPGRVWDESSAKAHWKNRGAGQPFFAVYNSVKSHESQVRRRPYNAVHDPDKVRIPSYHPDTPEVRQDWAQYYDVVSEADADAGKHLDELAAAGLADDTIVFYFADHGPGLPRNKRWPSNSGLHVPLVIYIPEKFKHLRPPEYEAGGKSDRPVSFVDFAPTVLNLAAIKPPDWMQGHAFLGLHQSKSERYVYGFRGRMDERYDVVRSVTDGRFVYIRNYMPHKVYGQHVDYMFETPTTQVWKKLHDEGKLDAAQDIFWQTKPPEELYDVVNDPYEVENLAAAPDHNELMSRLRQAQQELVMQIRDVGFLPEGEIHSRSQGSTPFNMAHDDSKYPLRRIFHTAELASMLDPDATDELKDRLNDTDSAVRYWAALGFLMRGKDGVEAGRNDLVVALRDPSPFVSIVAAEALAQYGKAGELRAALEVLGPFGDWSKHEVFVSMAALNAIDSLGRKAMPLRADIDRFPDKGPVPDARYTPFVPTLLKSIRGQLR
jgi:uncharacterized sulfatase